nr:MAG TPA: hypothetical protein [Caudoviricetes sp.]
MHFPVLSRLFTQSLCIFYLITFFDNKQQNL